MGKYNSHEREKQNLKLKAALAKPQRPNYGDQVKLAKTVFDFDEKFNSEIRKERKSAAEGLSKQLSGNEGGTGTEAFFRGVNSGLLEGSILDDKKRMASFKSGLERWKGMVESQNEELARQERLYNARQAIMPNWMAFSKSYKSMSPAEIEKSVDDMVDKYNQVAGTNYKRGAVDIRQPWKVTVIDGDEAKVIDMMDLMKTPEEMRVEMMMQTPEYRQMEQAEAAQLRSSPMPRSQRGFLPDNQGGAQGEPQIVKLPNGDELDVSSYPLIRTAAERNKFSKTYNGMSKVIRELQDVYDEVVELEGMASENEFSPVGSRLGEIPNKVKDWLAKGNEADSDLNKEVILRNKIESRFQQLQPVLEQYIKGAAPDSQLLARMHKKGVYPETNQSFPVIKSKLEMLINTATEDRDIAGASLSSERQVPFLREKPIRNSGKPEKENQGPPLTREEADTISAIRAENPGKLDNYTDSQVRDWAKAKGLL